MSSDAVEPPSDSHGGVARGAGWTVSGFGPGKAPPADEPPSISACLLCGEHVDDDDEGGTLTPVLIADSSVDFGVSHRECLLRDVMGGIGHLIAHEHWCVERHDPDAGLTYRQSALLCAAFATIVGVDGAARRD